MSLRERLSMITKLEPMEQPQKKNQVEAAPSGFALPAYHKKYNAVRPLSDLAVICAEPDLAGYSWEQVALVDTETTWLSTGSGTYAFLVGIGTFQDEVLTVRQYFLPSPVKEPLFWVEVLPMLCDKPVLVTFNGKSYDLPLINTRLIMNGCPALAPALHLDLLHAARRLWRRTLNSCALQSLEEHKLNHVRQDDVPGAEIPALYFNYIQTGELGLLKTVFRHNQQDISSLFELALALAACCAGPDGSLTRAEEFFGLADALLRAGDGAAAISAIESGYRLPGDRQLKQRYLAKLAQLYARQGNYPQALRVWQQVARAEPYRLDPLVEMAKLYEHRLKDLPLAWEMTEKMLSVGRRRQDLGVPLSADEAAEIERRRKRLSRHLG